ncbi:MAG TPA: RNA-binding S4 domain-containing protein [Saprospiraceae bacterium]|nr:RNA-binding S4 domain-containing protein [Saprospiraceae bacterium]HRO73195.1 RNA-binding S4 domain-containing protein [Saprospiraceae bacterium]HRP41431.1 RNA-binding S4 domain-containing protein [Saprospiraceae bacterium]
MSNLTKVRLDKWLWAVRIFKSRTMSTDACKGNKVKVNGIAAKPSFQLSIDDQIEVKKNGFNFTFKAKSLIDKRVSAVLAVPCYDDLTPSEELNKYKDWYVGKVGVEVRDKGDGRPTKRDRRDIDDFKDSYFMDDDLIEVIE